MAKINNVLSATTLSSVIILGRVAAHAWPKPLDSSHLGQGVGTPICPNLSDLGRDEAAERPTLPCRQTDAEEPGLKMFLIEVLQSSRPAGMSCISVCLGSPTFDNFNIHGENFSRRLLRAGDQSMSTHGIGSPPAHHHDSHSHPLQCTRFCMPPRRYGRLTLSTRTSCSGGGGTASWRARWGCAQPRAVA